MIGTNIADGEFSNNYTKILLKKTTPDTFDLVIAFGKCESLGYYEYCYLDNVYNFDNPKTINNGDIRPAVKIQINHYSPSIVVERPQYLLMNFSQDTPISINFINNGIKDFKCTYEEQIPDGLVIVDSGTFVRNGNTLSKNVFVAVNDSATLTYKIKSYTYQNYSWSGVYRYTYESQDSVVTTPVLKVTANSPFSYSDTISKSETNKLDDTIVYTIVINNIDATNDLKTIVYLNPLDFNILDTENFVKNRTDNGLYAEKSISPASSMNFSFRASAPIVKDYNINSVIVFQANNYLFTVPMNKVFKVKLVPMQFDIIPDRLIVKPGESLNVSILMNNSDTMADYYFIYGQIKGVGDEYITYPRIYRSHQFVDNKTYVIPDSAAAQDVLVISFNGIYRTANAQDIDFAVSKSLRVDRTGLNVTSTQISYNQTHTQNNDVSNPGSQSGNAVEPNPDKTSANGLDEEGPVDNRDFLTKIFDGINNFVKSIFG